MRSLLLLGLITFFIQEVTKAQWDRMHINTQLHYKCYYSKVNQDNGDTLFSSETKIVINIDTIIRLSGKERKIVFLSEILDTYGGNAFKKPKGANTSDIEGQYELFKKNNCTLFYFTSDTIYAIAVPKKLRNYFNQKKYVKILDFSLAKINLDDLESSTETEPFLDILGIRCYLQPFKILKGNRYSRLDKYYKPNSPYEGFYTLYNQGKWNEYISPSRRSDAHLEFTLAKGIVKSYVNIVSSDYNSIFMLELMKIVYPK